MSKVFKLERLRGVDFSTVSQNVDISRSPDMLNMIADKTGKLIKRPGAKKVLQLSGKINGIFTFTGTGTKQRLVHCGTALYLWNASSATAAGSGMADGKSVAFQMNKKLWILDGTNFWVYDGASLKNVREAAYIPTTSIARTPKGGGSQYESVNLLQSKRKNKFGGTETDTQYQLDFLGLNADAVTVRQMNENGVWIDKTENVDFTVDRANGKIVFVLAPGKSPITGEDNIEITASKTVESYGNMVEKCTMYAFYGVGGLDRVFVSGSGHYQNRDWYCDSMRPEYFPDLNYSVVGQDNTKITGYHLMGDKLAVLKEDSEQDASVFLRNGKITAEGKTTFSVLSGIAGVGSACSRCCAILKGDPLFLSRSGVFALTTNAVTGERYARGRSFFIDKRLTKEGGKAQAEAIVYDGRYYLSVGGHIYVADGGQKTYTDKQSEGFEYEWYLWNGLDVRVWYKDGALYFGTSDGCVMELTEDAGEDDGKPILAHWTTPEMAMEDITKFKTIEMLYAHFVPYIQSGASVWYKENGRWALLGEKSIGLFSFLKQSFGRFTFNCDTNEMIAVFKPRLRKTQTLCLRFENKEKEPFGLLGAAIVYDKKRYVK